VEVVVWSDPWAPCVVGVYPTSLAAHRLKWVNRYPPKYPFPEGCVGHRRGCPKPRPSAPARSRRFLLTFFGVAAVCLE